MKIRIQGIAAVAAKVPVLLVIVLAFILGYLLRGAVLPAPSLPSTDRHTQHVATTDTAWTCSMHPQIRQPRPGPCPICGMDLIPTEPVLEPVKSKPVKYACSMLCLPPMDRPGKCPVCGMDMVPVDVDDSEVEEPDAAAPKLTLSPKAQMLADIRLAPVERKFVSAEIRMVGKVEYDETRLGYLTAWVPGRLDRLYVDYTGIPVNKGEHMVYLYSPDLSTAQAELLHAIEAVKDLERSDISRIRDTARDDVEAARDKLRLLGLTEDQIDQIEQRGTPSDHMTIYAPMGGIVIDKNAVEGMYVETGTRIYTIADLSHVWVKLDAYESDLAWLRYGQEIEFHTEAYPGDTFTGKIAFIDPVLNTDTRTVKVRVNVENTDGRLKPGMFVRAVARSEVAAGGKVMDPHLAGKWICPMHPEIVKEEAVSCDLCGMPLVTAESLGYVSVDPSNAKAPLVIPASAPLVTGKRAVVYVALPDRPRTYEGREIMLGPRAGDYYLVRRGLREGELVVVNGNFKIDSAMQILARPSMMNPRGEEAHSGAGGSGGHRHD
ncbi:MAG: efflux RND transporter periplasmic adaptor subunit [Phycisphaerales bacterium]|nr:MAG: efflux RND transporter periplasmic adaptor subunit [Phycisphaerales bacterium]